MKSPTHPARHLLACFLSFILITGFATSAEVRTWTNLKGQTIKAKLLSVDDENVNLQLENGSRYTIERKKLSATDNQWLTEYGGAKEAPIDPKAKIGVPEKTMKFDAKTLIGRDDKFVLPEGFSLEFKITESEHFLVLTSGSVRGKDTAELAERMWYGMNFYHPGFKAKWGDKKRAIFLCGEESDWDTLGDWKDQLMRAEGQDAAADTARLTWPRIGAGGIGLDVPTCDKYNLARSTTVFKAFDKRTWRRGVWNAFPSHVLAGDVLGEMMGGAGGGVGSSGYFAISKGHSYFKEIQLCDETVTQMISADAYKGDEVSQAGGFKDGRKWARTLRDLVKKGKVTPTLAKLWAVESADTLTPELTVSMYGLARYMQSTPERMRNYSAFLDRVDKGRAIPQPIETAKLFGFDSVEAFEADWIEYLKGNDFK